MKKNKTSIGISQTDLISIAEDHPWLSWACLVCGYHAKTDEQKTNHENKKNHKKWHPLKWNNGTDLRNAPPSFSFVDPLY